MSSGMMKKKLKVLFNILFVCVGALCFLGGAPDLSADPLYDDPEQFIINNPDGRKYEFVRSYLNALLYFKENEDRENELPVIDIQNLKKSPSVKPIIDGLKRDNVNLRIARNLIDNFDAQNNALIIKVGNIFQKVTDDLIEYNRYDQALYAKIFEIQNSQNFEDFKVDRFLEAQELLAAQRRESWKELMEASMLINVVLVSTEQDYYGEFYRLGITAAEREKLLFKLQDFDGTGFSGKIEEGQTFLQGSVNIIKSILENSSWETLE